MLLVCYGSLKQGFHNNWRLGKDAKPVGHIFLTGAMYLHVNYPKLYAPSPTTGPFGPENLSHVKAEIWLISDTAYESIKEMEIAEGYEEKDISLQNAQHWPIEGSLRILTGKEKAKSFWMPHENFNPKDTRIGEYTYKVLPEDVRMYLERNMPDKPL